MRSFINIRTIQILVYALILVGAVIYGLTQSRPAPQDVRRIAIDDALFYESEFFGSRVLVPFPAATARENLSALTVRYANDREISLSIAELDESLENFPQAEESLKLLGGDDSPKLLAFYERRGDVEKRAAILESRFTFAAPENRAETLRDLFSLARRHDLTRFLDKNFIERVAGENSDTFPVIAELIGESITSGELDVALDLIDRFGPKFPYEHQYFFDQRLLILVSLGRTADAERSYAADFDTSSMPAASTAFYDFLNTNGRFRDYRTKLRDEFRKHPTDFSTAMRLVHLESLDGNDVSAIIDSLSDERRKRKIRWSAAELLTVSEILLANEDPERASRFLYTLCLENRLDVSDDLRRRVLYQIFQILIVSSGEKPALADGDLSFFKRAATVDVRPGITTGILSLIFADARIDRDFREKEQDAQKLFNRAAAHRVFEEFRSVFADAPELAQMYLDLVRLNINTKQFDTANELLGEFVQTQKDFRDVPDAALKLADAFVSAGEFAREREVYVMLLDLLGNSANPRFRPAQNEPQPANAPMVFYGDVLERLVASLTRAKMRNGIVEAYAREIQRYPDDAAIVERFAGWLSENGETARLGEVYRNAMARFPEKTWKHRFARWLIREKRDEEFAGFATSVAERFEDPELRVFLGEFVDNRSRDRSTADGRLYAGIYLAAHRRFPHNINFVKGLLKFYRDNKLDEEWRKLAARYMFESVEIRTMLLDEFARKGDLRSAFEQAKSRDSAPYRLFRAEAATRLSEFEGAFADYRSISEGYPQYPELREASLHLARSLGQKDKPTLRQAADLAKQQAERFPADAAIATRAGEIFAELGEYQTAGTFWKTISKADSANDAAHLETAAVFWDYYQFDEALAAIGDLRQKRRDERLLAFEAGAIREAKGDRPGATVEYLSELELPSDEVKLRRAKNRLAVFLANDAGKLADAFEQRLAAAADPFRLTFNFADVFFRSNRQDEAVKILLRHAETETSTENLRELKLFFRQTGEIEALRTTLRRLIATAERQQDVIANSLQLAENYRESRNTPAAVAVLERLHRDFPSNYGVLKETESFFWDMGLRDRAFAVLSDARRRARGEHRYRFDRKSALRLTSDKRNDEAARILESLAAADPLDAEVFDELMDLYVVTDNAAALKLLLDRNIAALRIKIAEPREFAMPSGDLRRSAIRAFTRLKSYEAASEQFVEMINLSPVDDELLDEALAFAARYGGTDKLIEYYEKTAAEGYKNYRWNVVLARLYAARGDFGKAAANYRTAIFNQPEMTQLYEGLVDILIRSNDFEGALTNLDKVIELAGEDPELIKRKAFLLGKLGRNEEAAAETAKLPAVQKQPGAANEFQWAASEKEPLAAAEKYRTAFSKLLSAPTASDIKSSDIADYFRATSTADSFAAAIGPVWELRNELAKLAAEPTFGEAKKAVRSLKIVEDSMTDAASKAVATTATGDEIVVFHNDLEERLNASGRENTIETAYLLNLINRCGFHDIEERFYKSRFGESADEATLRSLVSFYQRRGELHKLFALLKPEFETRPPDLVKIFAETARNLENREDELKALRLLFERQALDPQSLGRYFELLDSNDRAGLELLAKDAGPHTELFIRFLLLRKETALALTAVETSQFPESRKRRAAVLINNFADNRSASAESVFLGAGLSASIGDLTGPPRTTEAELPPDWLSFAGLYGEWLGAAGRNEDAARFISAQTEYAPRDKERQFRVGYEFHKLGDFARAAEHFEIALELSGDSDEYLPFAGAARFRLGDTEKAFEYWSKLIAPGAPQASIARYVRTLNEFGLGEKARSDVRPVVAAALNKPEREIKGVYDIVGEIAATFGADDDARAGFFIQLASDSPTDLRLPQQIVERGLVSPGNLAPFYELLIERSQAPSRYDSDYRFAEIAKENFDGRIAEAIYDLRTDFKPELPDSQRVKEQQKYLSFLLGRRYYEQAEKLIREITGSLEGRYARPEWLRLADWRIRLQKADATVFDELLVFAAVRLPAGGELAVLPDLERLNAAEALLAEMNKPELRDNLREAFYARQMAVGTFETAGFLELARLRFRRGDSGNAVKILRLLSQMPSPEAITELQSIPFIAAFADRERLAFEETDKTNKTSSLALAAEISAEFGEIETAAAFRSKLSQIAPGDSVNLTELARLDAFLGRDDEAANILVKIAANRFASRSERWRAILVAIEVASENGVLQQKIDALFAENPLVDSELIDAWKGNAPSGILTTFEARFLNCTIERKATGTSSCLSETATTNALLAEVFGPFATAPEIASVEDQINRGNSRLAVVIAKRIKFTAAASVYTENRFPTLERRAAARASDDLRRVLPRISVAAEETGDLGFAIEIETVRIRLEPDDITRDSIAQRLDELKARLAATESATAALPQF